MPRAQPRRRAAQDDGRARSATGRSPGTRRSACSRAGSAPSRYAERWIIDRQELDGSWGGIQPPWVWSLIALACRGHGLESPYVSRGLAGWKRFMVEEGDRLRPEACQSPVWDTGLALLALRAADVPAEEPALEHAAHWLVAEEIRERGDWTVRRPGLEAGGWAFEYDNDLYPDIDDAADRRARARGARLRPAHRRARLPLDGRHAVVERRLGRLRRRQRRAVALQDPVLRLRRRHRPALGRRDRPRRRAARARGGLRGERAPRDRLPARASRRRTARGSGAGASTTSTAPARCSPRCGPPASRPTIRRSAARSRGSRPTRTRTAASARTVARTTSARQVSPGAGAVSRPRRRPRGRCSGSSRPARRAPTARRAPSPGSAENQRPDGGWDEDFFTGTGFPRDFLINYHLYREVWPVMALGRVRRALAA